MRARRPELYGILVKRFGNELDPRQARLPKRQSSGSRQQTGARVSPAESGAGFTPTQRSDQGSGQDMA